MSETMLPSYRRWAGWFIRQNPTYLLSAAYMALWARLYLVSPRTRAGDLGLILLTLGVLQCYEWAVTVILLALHRRRSSPEDEPSLMLVAALFAMAGYLLIVAIWRQSRIEVLLALFVNHAAITVVVWDRWPSDVLVIALAAGWSWLAALMTGLGHSGFYFSRWATSGEHATAALVMIAFALLGAGAVISWHKPRLLNATAPTMADEPMPPVEPATS